MTRDTAYRCTSSVSLHAIRRGSITHSLNSDMPNKVVSDRANVSLQVIEQRYDRRTERKKWNSGGNTWTICNQRSQNYPSQESKITLVNFESAPLTRHPDPAIPLRILSQAEHPRHDLLVSGARQTQTLRQIGDSGEDPGDYRGLHKKCLS